MAHIILEQPKWPYTVVFLMREWMPHNGSTTTCGGKRAGWAEFGWVENGSTYNRPTYNR